MVLTKEVYTRLLNGLRKHATSPKKKKQMFSDEILRGWMFDWLQHNKYTVFNDGNIKILITNLNLRKAFKTLQPPFTKLRGI